MIINLDFKQLNKCLDKMILNDDEPFTLEDYAFEDKLCNMILDNTKSIILKTIDSDDVYECKSRMSLETSKQISVDFFNSINEKYGELLKTKLSDGTIKFVYSPDYLGRSSFDIKKSIMNISYYKNITDVYIICHEFTHFLNDRNELETDTTDYTTEIFSSYIEFLVKDYLDKNYPQYKKDNSKIMRNNLISLYQRNLMTKTILELIKLKLDGENISYATVKDLIIYMKQYASGEQLDDIINDSLDKIDDTDYESSMVYTLALSISPYLYDCFNKKEIMSLIDIIPSFDMTNMFDYIKLDEQEEDNSITEESCKKLEKSYKKTIKGLW